MYACMDVHLKRITIRLNEKNQVKPLFHGSNGCFHRKEPNIITATHIAGKYTIFTTFSEILSQKKG